MPTGSLPVLRLSDFHRLMFLLAVALSSAVWSLQEFAKHEPSPAASVCQASCHRAPAAPAARPIADVQLGQRLVGQNPLRGQAETWTPNEETWREVRLHLRKSSGNSVWIGLLRPVDWCETHGARVGATIDLQLQELGASGSADVLSVGPCPPIEPGDDADPIVTGTFKHEVDQHSQVLDLWIEGQAEPTGVTANHPYWSVDRQQSVPVSELQVGEHVDAQGGTAVVASVELRPHQGFVYNLETTEHVYRVGSRGTLVHNACPTLVDGVDTKGVFHQATLAKISPRQRQQIQEFAERYNVDVIVTGSRARGTTHALSDFDYIIRGGNSDIRGKVGKFLPRGPRYVGEFGPKPGFDIISEEVFDPNFTHIIFSPGP